MSNRIVRLIKPASTDESTIEFYTDEETGASGMSQSGLAVLCNTERTLVGRLIKKLRSELPERDEPIYEGSDLVQIKVPKRLKHLQGKRFTLCSSKSDRIFVNDSNPGNLEIYTADFCADIINYYASDDDNEIAQLSARKFTALGITPWIQNITGWRNRKINIDDELLRYSERKSIREALKDIYRRETMETVANWVKENGGNAPKTCAEFHDRMNERIYGAIARHIRDENGIPEGELIRDYFPSHKMMLYSTVYQAAKNLMIDEGMSPLNAVDRACEIVLGKDYVPSKWLMEEPLRQQGKRLKEGKRRKFGMQLQLEFFY